MVYVHINLFINGVTREIKKAKKAYYKTYYKTLLGIKEIVNLKNKGGSKVSQLHYENLSLS